VADPFDLAHALLSVAVRQDAEAEFDAASFKTGDETTVKLLREVLPVHLVYFTAYPGSEGPHRLSPRHLWAGRGPFRGAAAPPGWNWPAFSGKSWYHWPHDSRATPRTAWPTRSATSQRPWAPRPKARLT
jgi:hypothetical protein